MRDQHPSDNVRDPLSDRNAERLLRAALTLRRMPAETASSIAVVDLEGSAQDVAAVATRIAAALPDDN